VLLDRGEKALDIAALARDAPDLYANILWYFPRLHVPVPMRSGARARHVIAVVHAESQHDLLHRCAALLGDDFARSPAATTSCPPIEDNNAPPDAASSSSSSSSSVRKLSKSPSARRLDDEDADVCRSIFGSVSPNQTFFVFS